VGGSQRAAPGIFESKRGALNPLVKEGPREYSLGRKVIFPLAGFWRRDRGFGRFSQREREWFFRGEKFGFAGVLCLYK